MVHAQAPHGVHPPAKYLLPPKVLLLSTSHVSGFFIVAELE